MYWAASMTLTEMHGRAEMADAYAKAQSEATRCWAAFEANDHDAVAHALSEAFAGHEVQTVQACASEGHAVVALCYPETADVVPHAALALS
jgi:hypothetical protein